MIFVFPKGYFEGISSQGDLVKTKVVLGLVGRKLVMIRQQSTKDLRILCAGKSAPP